MPRGGQPHHYVGLPWAWATSRATTSSQAASTRSLPSAHHMARLLGEKGIPHELDVWGFDVAHDWPWWQRQIAHVLPRFC